MARKSRKKRGRGMFDIKLGKPCKGIAEEFSKKCGTKNCEPDSKSKTGFSCKHLPGAKIEKKGEWPTILRKKVNCSKYDKDVAKCKTNKWCSLNTSPQGEYKSMTRDALNNMPASQLKFQDANGKRNLYCEAKEQWKEQSDFAGIPLEGKYSMSDLHHSRDSCKKGIQGTADAHGQKGSWSMKECHNVTKDEGNDAYKTAIQATVGAAGGRRKRRRKSRKKKRKSHKKKKTKRRRKSRKKRTKRRRRR